MITVNVPTTAAQDTKINAFLTKVNNDRTAQGLPAYADINAFCTDILTQQLLSFVQTQKDLEAQVVATAFKQATNAVQNQVKTDLGL